VQHSNLPEQFRIEPRAHGRDDASGVLLRKANEQQRLIGQGKTSRQILRQTQPSRRRQVLDFPIVGSTDQ